MYLGLRLAGLWELAVDQDDGTAGKCKLSDHLAPFFDWSAPPTRRAV